MRENDFYNEPKGDATHRCEIDAPQRNNQEWAKAYGPSDNCVQIGGLVFEVIMSASLIADKINAALAAAVESAVVHPAELITKMVKLGQQLAAEHQHLDLANRDRRRMRERICELERQLLSALAAIAEHNKFAVTHRIVVDLSDLDKHDAEVRKPLVDALARIRDEAVTLVDARKFPDSVLHIEAPKRIKQRVNDALAKVKGTNNKKEQQT